jgi:hypothetical protein
MGSTTNLSFCAFLWLKIGFVSEGEGQEGAFAVEAELGADVRAVTFDGADTDKHLFGDLFVAHRSGDQQQDAPFRSGEIIKEGNPAVSASARFRRLTGAIGTIKLPERQIIGSSDK